MFHWGRIWLFNGQKDSRCYRFQGNKEFQSFEENTNKILIRQLKKCNFGNTVQVGIWFHPFVFLQVKVRESEVVASRRDEEVNGVYCNNVKVNSVGQMIRANFQLRDKACERKKITYKSNFL